MHTYSMSANYDENDIQLLLNYTKDRELIISTLKKFDGDLKKCIPYIIDNC